MNMIPQILMLAIVVIGCVGCCFSMERDREWKPSSKHECIAYLVSTAITQGILLWGGFYAPLASALCWWRNGR